MLSATFSAKAITTHQQNRHRNGEAAQLLLGDRCEARIIERTGDRVLAQTRVQIHRTEGSDATAQPMIASDFPRHKEWA